jgi:hypothetical protein
MQVQLRASTEFCLQVSCHMLPRVCYLHCTCVSCMLPQGNGEVLSMDSLVGRRACLSLTRYYSTLSLTHHREVLIFDWSGGGVFGLGALASSSRGQPLHKGRGLRTGAGAVRRVRKQRHWAARSRLCTVLGGTSQVNTETRERASRESAWEPPLRPPRSAAARAPLLPAKTWPRFLASRGRSSWPCGGAPQRPLWPPPRPRDTHGRRRR